MATTPAGSIRLCCDSVGEESRSKDKYGKDFKVYRSGPEEYLNSENFKKIRSQMLNGEIPKSCINCSKREDLDGESPRLHFLNKYQFSQEEAIRLIDEDGTLIKPVIKSIDLRLGNNCNLKCRMCNPWSSSSLKKEFELFHNESVPELNWPEHYHQWIDLVEGEELLVDLYLTGGEPTLIKNNLLLLKKMSSAQRNRVKVRVNTNGTVFNENFFLELSYFKNNDIKISLDGIGVVNNYIRYPSNWDNILVNLEKLKKIPGLKISTHLTLSSYNVLSLQSTLEGFEKVGLPLPFIDFVHEPTYLNISYLPPSFKESFASIYSNSDNALVASVQEVLGQSYDETVFNELRKRTKAVDHYRGTFIKDFIPEVARLIE